MCAWKRGTQNNQPGTIRKGHIREFIAQSCRDNVIDGNLMILEAEKYSSLYTNNNVSSSIALICSPDNGLPSTFLPYIINNSNDSNNSYDNSILYLHAHEYPRSIIKCIINSNVPNNSIIMSQALRVNSKVCIADNHNWSVYLGDITMYDCREGAIGDHRKRFSTKPPPILKNILIEIQVINRSDGNETACGEVQGVTIVNKFAQALDQCVVTIDDVYLIDGSNYSNILGRIIEVHPDIEDEDSDSNSNEFDISNNAKKKSNKDALEQDYYRGVVDQYTAVYIRLSGPNNPSRPIVNIPAMPQLKAFRDIVHVHTNDEEMFPVKRALLRPCIALTSVVQKGRGKYRDSEDTESTAIEVAVDMDACTFDRVLLYLEHEARDEEFKFDPLLVNELRDAAIKLNVSGLRDICDKVLGSFQERVRNTPIRFSEVLSRNGLDSSNDSNTASSDSKETWLVMSGMVLDITRWLPEHPGGSTIIPEQALGVDCTVFFEIYHASRQSFLYLKEFYIGELALEDRETVPLPKGYQSGNCDGKASDAFLEQLSKVTAPWRLDVHKMDAYKKAYKSF